MLWVLYFDCFAFCSFYNYCFKLCLGSSCKNGNLSVDENTESVNASTDASKSELASDDCSPSQQHSKQSDVADRQTDNKDGSASSQHSSNETTAGAAFYSHPGTDCYESFGDVVKSASKTSELLMY